MPFGLKSPLSTFRRLKSSVFIGSIGTGCFVYIASVIIFLETLQEHYAMFREFFQNLRKCNLKIEPDKRKILKTELSYLGHVVTSESVKPDTEKVKAIKNFPIPKKTTDGKSFLGQIEYYR